MMHLLHFVIFLLWATTIQSFGPRKLYSLKLPATINSVTVMGRQIAFVGPWYIGVVDNVQWKFGQRGRMVPRVINKDIANPRLIGRIPDGTFKKSKQAHFWVTTWGTNDTSGAVYVLQQTNDYSKWGDISVDAGWNYEKTQWIDMNRDGLRDCLTARFRGGVGQMLWFQQPPGQAIWGQRILHEGMADGNFLGFIYDKKSYILIAGNQFNVLGLYWIMNKRNNWAYSRQVRFRVIDNYGKYYDVQYIDLNKDGREDVLTTTVQISSSRGHVLGYEIPYDIQNKLWQRRLLASGFSGDYAPGKATAFWANKWKRKSDRPSIFLSGAGEGKIYILSPKPKNSGWGYIKTAMKPASSGMIGIPFIIDLNGDSYPEIFVPQGNQVHVYSYDYSSSAKSAPSLSSSIRRPIPTRRSVLYRNPFFRPTTPPPSPAIPADALPVGPTPGDPSAGGLPLGPRRTNILGSSPHAGASPYPGSTGLSSNVPQYPGLPPMIPAGNLPPAGQTPYARLPSSRLAQFPSYPVPQGGAPISYPQQPLSGGNTVVNRPNVGSMPPAYRYQNVQAPNTQYSNQPPVQQPSSGLSYNSGLVVGPNGQWYQPYQPNSQQKQQQRVPATQQQQPVFHSAATNTSVAASDGENPMEPENDPRKLIPSNLVLTVTEKVYAYHSEAADACSFEKKVLCDLNQLHDAVDFGGTIPEFQWGWFSIENRAASLEYCSPGEMKWKGYICHNGMVAHLPVYNEASLPALCCSVVNWATVTKRRYSRKSDAEMECRNSSRHLCSLPEMITVWGESSYKGYQWGWFDSEDELLRMSHYCNHRAVLWPGYSCLRNKLEVTKIKSPAQEKGFCCPSSASSLSVSVFLSTILLIFSIFV